MISIDTKNLTAIAKRHGLKAKDLASFSGNFKSHLAKIKSQKPGFLKIFEDKSFLKEIDAYAKKQKGKFKDIVVLGIGGSALGTICLEQSLKPLFNNKRSLPRLHVLDNIDPDLIYGLEKIINYGKTLFIVTTKSGTTPETMAQYFYFRAKANAKKLDPKKHFVFITDPARGTLREIAKKEKIPCFDIPEDVGGRFSVLTAVSLLPAKLMGINTEKLFNSGKEMAALTLIQDPKKNLPWMLAAIQYLLYKKGKTIDVLMPYSQRLIRFADWFRQLLAESIGKKGLGITPVNALGATDQHSQSQLYNEGPNDKLIIFLEVKKHDTDIAIPNILPKAKELQYLRNVSFGHLLATEMRGTKMSLTKNNRPNITISIDKLDENSLGALFVLFEGATAYLADMMNVNAYNQPGVELSKIITKKLLLSKKHEH
jgi:glucose-6-phosphate isomerase